MNKEIEVEFQKWWAHGITKNYCSEALAKPIWNAAWTCAKLGQLERAKEEVHSELRHRLTAYAVDCFKQRDHASAKFLLDLADERHALWEVSH